MSQRPVITLPGPGGSTISCCIIPCGCILMLLAGVLLGGIGLALRFHARPLWARVAPVPAAAVRTATAAAIPGR